VSDASASAGSHVMVSGGSRGLGAALVEGLLAAGHRVSTFSRRPTDFTRALAANDRFRFFAADVQDRSALGTYVRDASEHFGAPFGLVNCAGVAVEGVLPMMHPDEIDRVLAVNLAGSLHLTRLVLRKMLVSRTGGSIVNISSIIGLRG